MFFFDSESEDAFEVTDDAIEVTGEEGEENGNQLPGNTLDEAMEEGEEDVSVSSEEDTIEDANESYLKMPEQKWNDPAPVWKCAVKVKNGAKCNFCAKVYKTKGGNTGGINRHVMEKPEVKVMMKEAAKKKAKLAQKLKEKKANLRNQPSILAFSVKRSQLM